MRINKRNLRDIDIAVNGIINDWSTLIQIWNIKPENEQPGWNPMMREIVGEIQYDKQLNVPVQLTDMVPVELETDVGGNKFIGEIILYVPLKYIHEERPVSINVSEFSLFILDEDIESPWRVKTMKRLPGEHIIRIIKMTGGD